MTLPQSNIVYTPQNTAEETGKYISDILALHIDRPILLLLAGGSSVKVLDYIKPEYLHDQITVTVTDERFTDDIGDNNFDTLQTTSFYNELIQVDAFCINTSVWEGDTVEGHAARFEKNIKEWMKDFPKGIIIGLYGMGADGHTAGIIPGVYQGEEFNKKFNTEDTYIAITDDKRLTADFPLRVTTTLSFMKKVQYPIFYITGQNKVDALKKALDEKVSYEEVPARVILDMQKPMIFTDIQL
jgi:6-phosphogluconolactonase/glucosamine-6-phosphate isomerase/deaminase